MAYSLNGSSQYVQLTDADALTPSPAWALSCWIRNNSGLQALYSQRVDASNRVDIFIDGGSTCYVTLWDANLSWTGNHGTVDWKHVLFYYNATGNSQAAYVQGVQKQTASATGGITNLAATGYIGSRQADFASYFSGEIAEFAIMDAIPTDAQIAALAAGYAPNVVMPNNLTVYCPMIRPGNAVDVFGGTSGTDVGSPTAASHPRIIHPRRRAAFSVTAAAAGYSSSFFRENAGLGAAGAGPFARANAGLGAIA